MKKNQFLANYQVSASIIFLILMVVYGQNASIQAQTCTPAPVGLVSWHSGDGNTLDSRSRNNGTLQNGATYASGMVGQSFSFDGVDDSEDLGNWFTDTSFTLEMWVKPGETQVQYANIVDNNHTISLNWSLQQDNNNTNFYCFTGAACFSLTPNVWQHLAVTYESSNAVTVFVNGTVVATGSHALNYNGTQFLRLGRWGGGGRNWNGQIDEFSVYNRILTTIEIQAIANAGASGKCKPTATVAPSGLVAFWSGDGNANDIVGGNNGTLSGGDFSYVGYGTDKVGQALTFNGNYDGGYSRVTIPDSPSLDMVAAGTIETWINMNFVGSTSCSIITKGRFDNNQASYNLVLWNGHLRVDLYKGDGSGEYTAIQIPAPPLWWNWIHVAITWDSTNLRLFLNGVQVGSTVYTFVRQDTNYPLYFGQATPGYGSFSGYLDEVSFYNRDLTQDEITSIFNAGIAGKLKDNTTATGSNVAVSTNGDATVTFPTVITGGITQQIPLDLSLLPSLPSGSTTAGLTYDIATTATFTGSPQVCFNLPSITDPNYFNNLRLLHLESNVWTNRTGTIDFSTRTLCSAGLTSLSPFAIVYGFVPTAANAAISGRVTTANGNGIRNVIIQLTSGTGETKFARTSSFGYYKFEDLEVGQTYILTVSAKRYTFANPTRVITLNEDLTDADFVSDGK